MSITININNLTLCHKGSNGISTATIPDVCKTPSPGGPVPIPYPNIAMSMDLMKGTTTVKADGGMMCANYGSEFFKSTGDEPGVVGGVVSSTFIKEATWITFSFDVKLQGKAACRLTDKMFHNHQNTVNASGLLQVPLVVRPEAVIVCEIICKCDEAPVVGKTGAKLKQQCVSSALQTIDNATGNKSTIKPEINYDMTKSPPAPIMSRTNPTKGSEYLPGRTKDIPGYKPNSGMVRRPDVTLVKDGSLPPTQDNIKGIFEIKFPPDDWSEGQQRDYEKIAGPNAEVTELSPAVCECKPEPKKEPVYEPQPFGVLDFLLGVALVATILTPVPGDEAAVAVLGGARTARLLGAF
jgi:hypothetical protein